jgi:hypothetical protein
MGPTPTLARRLWEAVEPIHAIVYFAPEPAEAARRVGLRGFWMAYFAGRAAPLGPVPSAPVVAMTYGFAPAMVERAIPDAWGFAHPDAVLDARRRRLVPPSGWIDDRQAGRAVRPALGGGGRLPVRGPAPLLGLVAGAPT